MFGSVPGKPCFPFDTELFSRSLHLINWGGGGGGRGGRIRLDLGCHNISEYYFPLQGNHKT